MPTISGRIVFDLNRNATIDVGDTGLSNVPVVLRDTVSGLRLTVLTDVNGNYSFINVPNGNYTITEAYGELGGVATPGDFSTAIVGPVPVGDDPPISFATNPPLGATNIDSITPNTLNVTVAGADLTNENFFDSPLIMTPIATILDPCSTIVPGNLITAADNGTFGSYSAGTAVNTMPPVEPYPGISPGFTYTNANVVPGAGYTIINILNNAQTGPNGWWRVADVNTGDETGRFMVINGANPGSVFFTQTIPVTPNTNYLFSAWIMNLVRILGFANPALGVRILDQNNNIIYSQSLGSSIPVNTVQPEWKEIGTALNSQSNTQLTVQFTSEGVLAGGNDFSIDNIEFRQIDVPSFTPVKTISKSYANIGDIVTYTVTLTNTCSNPLTSVTFQDTVPQGLSFAAGSVTINGVPNGAVNPNIGFSVPDIAGGGTATITFNAIVNSIPTPNNPTNNVATMGYSYSPVTGGIQVPYTNNSNIVPLQVNNANLIATKSVDKTYADVGDVLTYTVSMTNSGNVIANLVKITDLIPNDTTLVPGSLSANVLFTTNVPDVTIDLLNPIAPGATVTMTFQVTVDTIPTPNPIPNTATANYKFTVDPNNLNGTSGTNTTNTVNTTINNANLSITKAVDKIAVIPNGTLNYTITVTNSGNTQAIPAIVTDLIPTGTTYIANTLEVNGVPNGSNPNTGINIAPIGAGVTDVITFSVLVSSPPPASLTIPNTAQIDYSYIVNPSNPAVNVTKTSNQVIVDIANMSIVKSVDKAFAQVGDVVTYTSLLTNTGNVDLINVTFTDNPPANTTFIPNSVYINNVNQPGLNPASINVGTIVPGQIVKITYNATIDSLPVSNQIINVSGGSFSYVEDLIGNINTVDIVSNQVITQVILNSFQMVKTVDKAFAFVGESLLYTITATNNGNVSLNNVIVTDIIPVETTFVGGSVVIGGVPSPSDNPASGINIGTLLPGQSRTVSFYVTINTLPASGEISNTATATYNYIVDPTQPPVTGTGTSNTVITQVELNDVRIVKSVDKTVANVNDTITYNFAINNNGTVPIENTLFTDIPPTGTTFVNGSVTINGVVNPLANPIVGFTLGTINPNETVFVSFQVTVNSGTCISQLVNTGTLTYEYRANVNDPILTGSITSNVVVTNIDSGMFKQVYVDETLTLPTASKDIDTIVSVTVTIQIDQNKIIQTSVGTSLEGQVLTGKKIMIWGRLVQVIEYTTTPPDQTIYTENFEVPFCTFIVIDGNFPDNCTIGITPTLEDLYYTKLDSRRIFKNVTFLLEVRTS